MSKSGERCENVREGHTKGHQNVKGKIIGAGEYQSSFSFETFQDNWLQLLLDNLQEFQQALEDKMLNNRQALEKAIASAQHRQYMNAFYKRLGGAQLYISHTACFGCLREMPEHPLPCGHVLCPLCVKDYGRPDRGSSFQMDSCPLHSAGTMFPTPYLVRMKPELAGIRILALDG